MHSILLIQYSRRRLLYTVQYNTVHPRKAFTVQYLLDCLLFYSTFFENSKALQIWEMVKVTFELLYLVFEKKLYRRTKWQVFIHPYRQRKVERERKSDDLRKSFVLLYYNYMPICTRTYKRLVSEHSQSFNDRSQPAQRDPVCQGFLPDMPQSVADF
jgi:hypothetical protein